MGKITVSIYHFKHLTFRNAAAIMRAAASKQELQPLPEEKAVFLTLLLSVLLPPVLSIGSLYLLLSE